MSCFDYATEAFSKVLFFGLNNLTCFNMIMLSSPHPLEQQSEFFKKMKGSWRISAADGSDTYFHNLLLHIT
jgi:hypothetical protein